jgi:Domain of unknown function (DUF4124)
MRPTGFSLVICTCILGVVVNATAESGVHNRYKWTDAQGNLHYDDALPTEALQFGYVVVNAQGIVVKRVDRARTTEEMKADEAAAVQKAAQNRAAEEQTARDQQVLSAYPNERELVSSQQAQLDMLDQNILATELSLQSQEKSLTENLSHAAELDRNGKPVPATLQSQIESLRQNIEKQKAYISGKQEEKTDNIKKFEAELTHYREVRAKARSN